MEAIASWQQRHSERYDLSVPIWLINADGITLLRTQTTNIGRDGALVVVQGPSLMYPRQRISIRVGIPDADGGTPLRCIAVGAEVRHVSRLLSEDGDCWGVGLRFDCPLELSLTSTGPLVAMATA